MIFLDQFWYDPVKKFQFIWSVNELFFELRSLGRHEFVFE